MLKKLLAAFRRLFPPSRDLEVIDERLRAIKQRADKLNASLDNEANWFLKRSDGNLEESKHG